MISLEGIILNIDLSLIHLVLPQQINQSHKLLSFDLLGVEIVRFGYIQMGHEFFRGFLHQKGLVDWDFVEILLVRFLLEVVSHCQLRRVVLQKQLGWHGWDKAAGE